MPAGSGLAVDTPAGDCDNEVELRFVIRNRKRLLDDKETLGIDKIFLYGLIVDGNLAIAFP